MLLTLYTTFKTTHLACCIVNEISLLQLWIRIKLDICIWMQQALTLWLLQDPSLTIKSTFIIKKRLFEFSIELLFIKRLINWILFFFLSWFLQLNLSFNFLLLGLLPFKVVTGADSHLSHCFERLFLHNTIRMVNSLLFY